MQLLERQRECSFKRVRDREREIDIPIYVQHLSELMQKNLRRRDGFDV